MRLSTSEQSAIVQSLAPFLNQISAELRLFGSRVDDQKKGGDIDLLLILEKSDVWSSNEIFNKKIKMLVSLYHQLGEQKIDLKIVPRDKISNDPFLKQIFSKSQRLHQWYEVGRK